MNKFCERCPAALHILANALEKLNNDLLKETKQSESLYQGSFASQQEKIPTHNTLLSGYSLFSHPIFSSNLADSSEDQTGNAPNTFSSSIFSRARHLDTSVASTDDFEYVDIDSVK